MKRSPQQRDFQLQLIFLFMIIYAGLLFLSRPNPTQGQVIFRVGIALAGLVGLWYVEARKRR